MAPEISTASSFYASAPTSPSRVFNKDDDFCVVSFRSVPVSPTRSSNNMIVDTDHDDVDTNPTTSSESSPSSFDASEDSNFNLDDFEFETSRRSNGELCEDEAENGKELAQKKACFAKQRTESLPAMAFSEESFCQGKVKPLKPPPRLHCVNEEAVSRRSTPPSSPTSILRIPFTRRNLWNDDFDPFMAALENVKEDKRGNHRRAKSMFITFPACMSEQSLNDDLLVDKNECRKKYYSMPNPSNHQNGNTEQKAPPPPKLAEPKGVVFARRARLVKMVNELSKKSSAYAFTEMVVETRQAQFAKELIGAAWSGQNTKRKKPKNFLFKSLSMQKVEDDSKQEEQYLEPKKPKITRKLSLMKPFVYNNKVEKIEENRIDENVSDLEHKKSKVNGKMRSKSFSLGQCKEEEKVTYRPSLLLCMGVGGKYVE